MVPEVTKSQLAYLAPPRGENRRRRRGKRFVLMVVETAVAVVVVVVVVKVVSRKGRWMRKRIMEK